MSTELLATLRTQYPSYTHVERDIADFVLTNSEEVVYMPIAELAARCEVGQTSVIRFCRRLGQSGYKVFRLSLSAALEAQRQLAPAAPLANSPHGGVADRLLQKHITALSGTRQMLAPEKLEMLVARLLEARHICLFGLESDIPATIAAHQAFAGCLWKCHCSLDSYTQRANAMALTRDDAAIIYSYTGRNEALLSMAAEAKKAAVFTVAITCASGSPLAAVCDASLSCCCCLDPACPSPLDRLTAQTAFAFVTETLCAACMERLREEP